VVYSTLSFAAMPLTPSNDELTTQAAKELVLHFTPEWEGLTNKDGSGLFHEIIANALPSKTIKVSYTPIQRALSWVKAGKGDVTGTITKTDLEFHYSRYPVWKVEIAALFHQRLLPTFRGIETIEQVDAVVGFGPGFEHIMGKKVAEVASREQAAYMLENDRLDYYIDDKAVLVEFLQLNESRMGFEVRAQGKSHKISNMNDYVIRIIKLDYSYFLFSNNKKGHRIEKLFSHNLKKLYDSGKLKQIYQKWGLEQKLPSLDQFN
jgi:hypothetical protein